jgi:hypothetical protein
MAQAGLHAEPSAEGEATGGAATGDAVTLTGAGVGGFGPVLGQTREYPVKIIR